MGGYRLGTSFTGLIGLIVPALSRFLLLSLFMIATVSVNLSVRWVNR